MSASIDLPDRRRLEELAVELREAIFGALERRWLLAQALDETRSEIERLLMMDVIERAEARRAIARAEVMLDAWSGLSGTARSR
jgi:hypothetical protein